MTLEVCTDGYTTHEAWTWTDRVRFVGVRLYRSTLPLAPALELSPPPSGRCERMSWRKSRLKGYARETAGAEAGRDDVTRWRHPGREKPHGRRTKFRSVEK